MTIPELIPPYVPGTGPVPNITPFTYRDGRTYLDKLGGLVYYLNNILVPFINENMEEFSEEFTAEVNRLIEQVNNAVEIIINDGIQVQDPVVAGIMANDDSQTRGVSDTIYAPIIGPAYQTEENTFSEFQHFSGDGAFTVGDKLTFKQTIGFAGHRLHVTGQNVGDMPYIEVVPTTKTGTDPGGSVAGIQVYNTTYGGAFDAPEREFVAIEAKGDLYSAGRMFRLGTWASGAGEYLPFRIGIGELNIVDFKSSGTEYGQIELLSKTRIFSLGSTIDNLIDFQRGTSFKALRAVVANAAANTGPKLFLGRVRGSIGSPSNLAASDRIGGIEFGSYAEGAQVSDATEFTTAYVRAAARESYANIATARGSQVDVGVTEVGTTNFLDAVRFADPAADTETGMFILVNRAGVKTLSRVRVGAAGSGSLTNHRMLQVANT